MMQSTHHMQTSLRDNRPSRGSTGQFLKDHITSESQLSIVSAYFTVNAYAALRQELESSTGLRFLFGEPSFVSEIDPQKQEKKNFTVAESGLELAHTLAQRPIAKACADWIKSSVEIRSIRQSGFLHGKAYHIQNGNASSAILGSSNFTISGLGLKKKGNNIELNLVVDSDRDRTDLLAWFDEVWTDKQLTTDVKAEVLTHLERLYANHPPQFIYYLTLFHLFRDELDGADNIDEDLKKITLLESEIWKMLFSFQKDGAKGAINKILSFNGCILADSVGLGKTFEALAVIRYFELRNERVLVLCPKKLRRNWTVYQASNNSRLNPLLSDGFAYTVLSHTDLSRTSGMSGDIDLGNLHWENYGLIVIDESHNFRNNSVGKPKEDGTPRRTRYERLMEDILQSGVNTKVLLLSATPVNNNISDLRNQISLIAGGDVARSTKYDAAFKEKLGIPSLNSTTRKAQTKFTAWTKKPADQRKARDLIHELGGDFFKLLDGLTISRSRSQIKRYYSKELVKLGGFPKRNQPQSEYPQIDALELITWLVIAEMP